MVSVEERDDYTNKMTINFEETELRLGLGLGLSGPSTKNNNGKRGFIETTSSAEVINNINDVNNVDLKLNLSSNSNTNNVIKENKLSDQKSSIVSSDSSSTAAAAAAKQPADHPVKPPAKAQVVGWPPVRSFRKNIVTVQKNKTAEEQPDSKTTNHVVTSGAFVKVSMDGAPYLRKVDLKLYKSYKDLSEALGKMFSSFTIGNCGSQGMKDFMNESKLIDLLNGSEYAATYEDKDGDWMLVGDVPWTMFVESCKRLRIMKGSEAIGLAPRAVEKCKSRS